MEDPTLITVIIGEAALETVPREIANHPSVTRLAERKGKKPEETLLDISFHYAAMKGLRDWERRGRPDITFLTLLDLLERPLNKEGQLQVYVHTINNFVIWVDPEINMPRNYTRFVGLMEQLFSTGRVPPKGKPLMVLKKGNIRDVINGVEHSKVVFLTERGRKVKLETYFSKLVRQEKPILVIGGFQRGEFTDLSLADEQISVYKKPLDAWIVGSMVSHELERALGII
uniref:Ribosomal RNA small subunit methyltransferase Nep1 n=1 Tax=Candidatus Methanosuratincola petrocarbonis (ex Vanwonterghem et al. 2016) TaxID=1867261 RepID=A0A7J3UZN5_9CREN